MSVHRPTVVGRVRSDPGLLALTALVVALTSALLAAVAPLSDRTADEAIAATVRDAGDRGVVVATAGRGYDDPRGETRDPQSAVELAQDIDYAQHVMPPALADVVRPGVATLSTPSLHLLDAGAGRYLRLAYVDPPGDGPSVRWVAGGAPVGSVGEDQSGVGVPAGAEWPVQVGVSQETADALGLAPGDRLPAEDEQARRVAVVVSGVFVAEDPGDATWRTIPELLHPSRGITQGTPHTAATALVSADSLPDLRLAVPTDDLTQRVVFEPRPERLRYDRIDELSRALAALQTSSGAGGDFSWDSLLDRVLDEGAAQVESARGQAAVLLVGLLVTALLLLVLAAQLLVTRRAGPVASARERGATLLGIAAELFVEALGVAVVGGALGLGVVWLVVGDVGWRWALPVVIVAALATPVLGALHAATVTDVRRVPANRSARRTNERARRIRRLLVEAAVVAAAVLSLVAVRQRGVVVDGHTDLTAASVTTWWALAGSLLVLRAVPALSRRALRATRRAAGGTAFFVASRVAATGSRALPLLVVAVAVAQLTVGAALATTERDGQRAGALLAVGGDARLTTTPAAAVADVAREVAAEPGVRAAASGRVADGVRASARGSAATVRLVVVDAEAYQRLLAASALPNAPDLALLGSAPGDRVPALLSGGDPDLRDDLQIRYQDADPVPLTVVGTAPRVDASPDPVVVVDAEVLAAHGLDVPPDTVWAVGPGARTALRAAADDGATLTLLTDTLTARRDAPLPSALVLLASASAALLLLLAALAVLLSAAVAAPARSESLGRLRAHGLSTPHLRRVLTGELLVPVTLAALTGLALGTTAALLTTRDLSLELVTGQAAPPGLAVPWWTPGPALLPVVVALAIAQVDVARLRRTSLSQLLRGGDRS